MIALPHNDRACLGAITEQIAAQVRDRDPAIVDLGLAHDSTADLADAIRTRPQLDDTGEPCDGPKVEACEPAQRLRIDPPDPNCVERAALYIAAAELIDPVPVRRLATARTPAGLHTFPTEDGEPVVLDPVYTRNALAAGLFRATSPRNGGTASLAMTPAEMVAWIARLAAEPAARFDNGQARIERGHRAVRSVLIGRPLCVADLRDVAFMLALADREARLWGAVGPRLVATTARAIDQLDRTAVATWQTRTAPGPSAGAEADERRNAVELKVGDARIRPDVDLIRALGRVGGRLGAAAGIEAFKVKLASLGVAPPVLSTIERELNREGLSLGPLATPLLGSLADLTPEALAGRWLASKL